MGLRAFLDDIEPHFSKDGKFSYLFPLYEAIDTALYTPGKVTGGPLSCKRRPGSETDYDDGLAASCSSRACRFLFCWLPRQPRYGSLWY